MLKARVTPDTLSQSVHIDRYRTVIDSGIGHTGKELMNVSLVFAARIEC
jgi:hypothetical protein